MKKQVILRGLIGVPIGITIGYLITIFISLALGKGYYSPCVPALTQQIGNEIGAVIVQTMLCAVLGAVFGSASVIWEMDTWSILKQTGVYFSMIALTMLPIAYATHWMEHTIGGFLLYFGIFVTIFIVVWMIQYAIWKYRVKKIAEKVNEQR